MTDSITRGFKRSAMVAVSLVSLVACGNDKNANGKPAPETTATPPATPALPAEIRIVEPRSYKAALKQGNELLDARRYAEAVAAFQAALEFKPDDPRALSEISWAAFQADDLVTARDAALASIRGARDDKLKAASLYNLGRVEEKQGNTAAARRAYTESLALRPNKTVRKRLTALGGQPVARGDDSISSRAAFETLASAVGRQYGLAVVALGEHDLDKSGALERVALLCAAESESGGYLIHNPDTEQRWLIRFSDMDGHSALEDGAGTKRCGYLERPTRRTGWITSAEPWLAFEQTHSGGGSWCRIAIRDSAIALLRSSYLGDARDGDEEEVTDYERSRGPYPDLAAASTEHCIADVEVQSISAATVRALLGKR